MQEVVFRDLGIIDYQEAWDYQTDIFETICNIKLRNKKENKSEVTEDVLLFCEHPHVYTLGKSGDPANMLLNQKQLTEKEATFVHINRGGDITYHGPGQMVGYPILDLEHFFVDIHKYIRSLEEIAIRVLADYGLKGERSEGESGVWLDAKDPIRARKILAIGVKSSRWVTMHGFAFNVNVDLSYFGNIIPCGIQNKGVTSLNKELGVVEVPLDSVKEKFKFHFQEVFKAKLV